MATALLTLVAATTQSQQKGEDAANAFLAEYVNAWNVGDASALAALYAPSGDYSGFGSDMTRGRRDIEARYTEMLSGPYRGTQLAVDQSSLRFLRGDVALVDGMLTLSNQPPAAQGPSELRGMFLAIFVRDAGRWQLTTFWSKTVESAGQMREGA